MRDITQHVHLQVFAEYLSPVAAPQKKADNQNADNTAKKQYLEGTQLARQLPSADGHGHERYQCAGHPKSGDDGMISIRLCECDDFRPYSVFYDYRFSVIDPTVNFFAPIDTSSDSVIDAFWGN